MERKNRCFTKQKQEIPQISEKINMEVSCRLDFLAKHSRKLKDWKDIL